MRAEYTISQAEVQLSAQRPLQVVEVPVGRRVEPHDHDYCEICLVTKGCGSHRTPHYAQRLEPGMVAVTFPGQVHAIDPERGLTVLNIYYLAEWFLHEMPEVGEAGPFFSLFVAPTLFRLRGPRQIPQFQLGRDAAAAVREMRDVIAENAEPTPSALYLRSAFGKFAIRLARAAEREGMASGAVLSPEVWLAVRRIEQLVETGAMFSLVELAAGLPFSPDRLSRLFRRQTGRNPQDYYQYRRLLAAGAQLLSSRKSITEVALAYGFTDASHFGRLFKRAHRSTPRAYRRKYRHGAET